MPTTSSQKASSSGRIRSINRNRWWIGGIAATLLIALSTWIFIGQDQSSQLAGQLYQENPPVTTLRTGSVNTDIQGPLEIGLKALESQQLQDAKRLFNQIAPSSVDHNLAQYYLGHVHYQLKAYEQADAYFQRFLQSTNQNDRIFAEAEFYTLLNLIEGGEKEKARALAQKIIQSPAHRYQVLVKKNFEDL